MAVAKSGPAALDWGLLVALGLIWGAAFLGVEVALGSLPPLWVAAGRISLAALLLVTVAYLTGEGLPGFRTAIQRRIWLHCLGMGLFTNAIPFSLMSWGQQLVTSSFAGITMAAVPLFVLPLSHFLIPGERLSPARVIGFLTGFGGVALLVGGDRLFMPSQDGGDVTMLMAQLACVGASCCYACGSIITRLCPPVGTLTFAAAGLLCASIAILPLAFFVHGVPSEVSIASWSGMVFLALLPTGLATILLTIIIRRAGPPFLSLVNYQVPVWAVLIGVSILGEALPGHFVMALVTILIGLAISQRLHRAKAA
ncbi:MAG: EamA family transporter [SAR116 cluster bacterium]|nr:EamA family transporter [SAR116 cluster bacterium]RPH00628.1 MAG: DMT family transporter [Candidatus Puniceispirillum sp. TMED176]|tara:strand:+ start:3213 stop:4145 length:933 start_codon:yes stop_codon:yes gene_type:complete